ncbi:MAG TPA: hypothetical protein DCR94_06360 [Firmicutes bacterium]|mgnify:FL=1|nr:hypothetical protein [Bacillota bacterium]
MKKEENEDIIETRKYIRSRWSAALNYPIKGDKYALPYPFVPPCINGDFHVLFYWDTFYTNRGMIADGYFEYAKYNVDNLIFALNKLGFVPNAYSENLIKWVSQPPYLHFMVKDIYEYSHDEEWLRQAYFALKKEYDFWMKERIAKNGLNRHFHNKLTIKDLCEYYDYVAIERLGLTTDIETKEKAELGENYCADAEAGLDFTPRFLDRGIHINPVDLNANLYGMELDLSSYAKKFEPELESIYLNKAKERKEKMDRLMLKEDGLYYDYDFDNGKIFREDYCFSGQFMPFITGLTQNKEGVKKLLSRLSFKYGITSTQKDEKETIEYQAAYPFSWPYDNYLAYWGLKELGLEKEAKEVGMRWLINLSSTYKKTGKLWETYDPFNGGRAKKKEYPANEMMGWTAGGFSAICNDLGIGCK